jgi:hypothetical protein
MKRTYCIECKTKVEYDELINKPLWCSMSCKKDFVLNNYNIGNIKIWFAEKDMKLKEDRDIVLEKINKSGLTILEYIEFLKKVE